jgi:hypothetical protein
MCCRITVAPLDPELARLVLRMGMFSPTDELGLNWRRYILEEGTNVNAILLPDYGALRLELSPAVSAYSHHADKRIAGGVYFEIAAKYAEKVGGLITQLSNVPGCTEGGIAEHVLARYRTRRCSGSRSAQASARRSSVRPAQTPPPEATSCLLQPRPAAASY